MKKNKSEIFSLNKYDFFKGLIVAILTGIVATTGQMVEEWLKDGSNFNISHVSLVLAGKAGIGAAIAYLSKNLLSNNAGKKANE